MAFKSFILVVLCFLVLTAASICSESELYINNSPKGKFATIAEYLACGQQPTQVYKALLSDKTYFVAIGSLHHNWLEWLALPSGPTAYVFDETGTLVDWSSDTGDDPKFLSRWSRPTWMAATLADLKTLAKKQTRTQSQ